MGMMPGVYSGDVVEVGRIQLEFTRGLSAAGASHPDPATRYKCLMMALLVSMEESRFPIEES